MSTFYSTNAGGFLFTENRWRKPKPHQVFYIFKTATAIYVCIYDVNSFLWVLDISFSGFLQLISEEKKEHKKKEKEEEEEEREKKKEQAMF